MAKWKESLILIKAVICCGYIGMTRAARSHPKKEIKGEQEWQTQTKDLEAETLSDD